MLSPVVVTGVTDEIPIVQCWLPAFSIVKGALDGRTLVDSSGEIIEVAGGCPWKEHMYGLEKELKLEKTIKFCIYEVRRDALIRCRRNRSVHHT